MAEAEAPKFEWREFFKKLYNRLLETDILGHAAQVAFYFSFAIFPLLYFLVSLMGMVLESSKDLQAELFVFLRQVMPYSVHELIQKTIAEVIENSSGGKATLGLAVTLWSASAGFDAIRNALNSIYGLVEQRYWVRIKLESLAFTLGLSIITGVMLYIVFNGWQFFQSVMSTIGVETTSPWLLSLIQWVTILVVTMLACEVIYNLLPSYGKFRWVWINAGSIAAIVLWIGLTAGFRTYLGYFNSYDRTYGSLGAVIIMMLWLYLTACALMLGGAINAVLYEMKNPHKKKPHEEAASA